MIKNLLASLILFPIIVMSHPIKMSLIYLDYSPDNKSVFIECRFFADDLSYAIQEETKQKIRYYNWSIEEEKIVDQFVNKHIRIDFSGKQLRLEPYQRQFDKSQKVVTIRYELTNVFLHDQKDIIVTTSMFFAQFGYMQTNVLQVYIPYVAETTIQSDQDHHTTTFKVKL